MLYMMTRVRTTPPVWTRATAAAPPMRRTPFWVVRRSERAQNRWGNQESTAMVAMTRGPAMRPAWAATTRRRASDTSTRKMKTPPKGRPSAMRSARTAFIVFPSSGRTFQRR